MSDEDLAKALGEATVLDIDGKVLKLGEAWAKKPALLVFVRHFG